MPGIEICRAFLFIHTKRSIFATKYQKKNRNEENLSCIPSAYYIVCLRQQNTNSVYLNGEIKGLGNDTLYIYGTDKFYNRMDTLLVKDDKFSATLTTDTLVSTWLQFSDGTEYPLYLNKGDKIKIKGSAAELTSLEITGNAPNEELTAFQKELKGLSTPSEKALEEKQKPSSTAILLRW